MEKEEDGRIKFFHLYIWYKLAKDKKKMYIRLHVPTSIFIFNFLEVGIHQRDP